MGLSAVELCGAAAAALAWAFALLPLIDRIGRPPEDDPDPASLAPAAMPTRAFCGAVLVVFGLTAAAALTAAFARAAFTAVFPDQPTYPPYVWYAAFELALLPVKFSLGVWIARDFGRLPATAVGLRFDNWRGAALHGVLRTVAWYPAILVFLAAAKEIGPSVVQDQVLYLRDASHPVEYAALAFLIVVAAPVWEELLFRGVAQTWLTAKLRGADRGVLAAALVFGGMHTGWPAPLALVILGVCFGVARHKTKSLASCIAAHAFFNGTMFVAALLQPSA
ncbi:MAG: lysostaphin resistance A-like protein [Planctomycetia bacterium]